MYEVLGAKSWSWSNHSLSWNDKHGWNSPTLGTTRRWKVKIGKTIGCRGETVTGHNEDLKRKTSIVALSGLIA